jgi:Spy/CpxP family protein refolding chaperone
MYFVARLTCLTPLETRTMRHVRLLVGMVMLAGLVTPIVVAQDKGKDTPSGKVRGTLPQNWGKLGLTDEQKQKVYEIQSKVRAKVDDLKAKIKDLQDQERKDMEGVLTPAQKARLREIIAGKAPGDK